MTALMFFPAHNFVDKTVGDFHSAGASVKLLAADEINPRYER